MLEAAYLCHSCGTFSHPGVNIQEFGIRYLQEHTQVMS